MKTILIVLIIPLLFGCSVVLQSRNDPGIREDLLGMSKEEVLQLKGDPAERRTAVFEGKEYEVWLYPVKDPDAMKVNPVGKFDYQIFFSGEKVHHWDKINVLAQPAYEYDEPDSSGKDITTLEVQYDR